MSTKPEPNPEAQAALEAFGAVLAEHDACEWEQIGPCVYCSSHRVRLYQGGLPTDRQPAHEHDWDYESGMGWYYVCRVCGEREWTE